MRNMKTSKLFISFSDIKDAELIPDTEFFLKPDDIIIYTIYLPDFSGLRADLSQFLNEKELKKAQRFHKEIDQNRFIVHRAILKFVLAAYTKQDIRSVTLDYNINKKPYLASHPWLNFNISHSNEFAVIGISRTKIGLDIEHMSEDFEFTDLLPDILGENEILTVQNAVDKKRAFYMSWTRKEAFVKALGKGIDDDFKYIPCLDGIHNLDSTLLKNTDNWQMYSFDLADHYLGAVAFEDLPNFSKNIVLYSLPNSMKELLEMTQRKNN